MLPNVMSTQNQTTMEGRHGAGSPTHSGTDAISNSVLRLDNTQTLTDLTYVLLSNVIMLINTREISPDTSKKNTKNIGQKKIKKKNELKVSMIIFVNYVAIDSRLQQY